MKNNRIEDLLSSAVKLLNCEAQTCMIYHVLMNLSIRLLVRRSSKHWQAISIRYLEKARERRENTLNRVEHLAQSWASENPIQVTSIMGQLWVSSCGASFWGPNRSCHVKLSILASWTLNRRLIRTQRCHWTLILNHNSRSGAEPPKSTEGASSFSCLQMIYPLAFPKSLLQVYCSSS